MSRTNRYPDEMKDQACRLLADLRRERNRATGRFTEVAGQLGAHPESLPGWFKQWQIDSGATPGVATAEQQRINDLERQVKELERSNAILRSASVFFEAELDRPRR